MNRIHFRFSEIITSYSGTTDKGISPLTILINEIHFEMRFVIIYFIIYYIPYKLTDEKSHYSV